MVTAVGLDQAAGRAGRTGGGEGLVPMLEALQMPFERYCELLELIYQGPLETVPCSKAMTGLRGWLRANGSVLILRPARANAMAVVIRDRGRGPKLSTSVYTQFATFSLDPFVGLPADRAVTLDEIIDPEKWVQGEFFKQYVEPRQVRYILGADIHGEECVASSTSGQKATAKMRDFARLLRRSRRSEDHGKARIADAIHGGAEGGDFARG